MIFIFIFGRMLDERQVAITFCMSEVVALSSSPIIAEDNYLSFRMFRNTLSLLIATAASAGF